MPTALSRSKVKKNQTWNAEVFFSSREAFDEEVKSLLESLPAIKAFQGHLGDSPDTFLAAMNIIESLSQRAAKVQVYATMSSAVDTADQQGAEMNSEVTSALAQVSAVTSFVDQIGRASCRERG